MIPEDMTSLINYMVATAKDLIYYARIIGQAVPSQY